MKLTVVIPTIGRDTLAAAVRSCAGADEVIVVQDHAQGSVATQALPRSVRLANVMGGDHGYTARTRGIELATGTHIAFLDDDDRFTTGAIDLMRAAACDRPVVFRMDHPTHGVLWREPRLEFGNVGTPMMLIPNRPGKFGKWEAHAPGLKEPGGDYTFLAGCVEQMGPPVWRGEVTALVDPGPTVSIVTPWLNKPELADDYLAAIRDGNPEQVLVIDNASDEPPDLPTVRLTENKGFSGGSNHGLDLATSDITLFLNNDIALTEHGWLRAIRNTVEPGVLVGAQLRHELHADVDGASMPYLDGWCLAGMTEDLRDIGGWDETFDEPSYFGDNDLCLRARAAGYTLREVRVGLRHKLNQTAGHTDHVRQVTLANQKRYVARARQLLGEAA